MLEHAPTSSAQSATNFNNGDRIDFHAYSEHVSPYAEKDIVEKSNKTPERREPNSHDQVRIIGEYIRAFRDAEINQYDFAPQRKDPLDFELTA